MQAVGREKKPIEREFELCESCLITKHKIWEKEKNRFLFWKTLLVINHTCIYKLLNIN